MVGFCFSHLFLLGTLGFSLFWESKQHDIWIHVGSFGYNVRPPATIAKLVNITPITMVYGTYNQLVTGAFVNQLITGLKRLFYEWCYLLASSLRDF